MTPGELMGGVDTDALRAVVRGTFMDKMADFNEQSGKARLWANMLGLEQAIFNGTHKPLRMLDLGCGLSYFVRYFGLLGHNATGLDVPGPIHGAAAEIMGVDFVAHEISMERLPEQLVGLDVVTMCDVSCRNWRRVYPELAADLLLRMNPGGRWLFSFHVGDEERARQAYWERLCEPKRASNPGSRYILLEF